MKIPEPGINQSAIKGITNSKTVTSFLILIDFVAFCIGFTLNTEATVDLG
uniref:Uncharacterized protein n=1 Tax=Desmonostoc muscorum LEGE 12446 TaxID=1828758 RepID=A0A8J7AGD3_DESMC